MDAFGDRALYYTFSAVIGGFRLERREMSDAYLVGYETLLHLLEGVMEGPNYFCSKIFIRNKFSDGFIINVTLFVTLVVRVVQLVLLLEESSA